tara:strand:- start:300 stop:4250 length:3951 start_codon:yes stop_codon:yes gene_type:complete
MTARRLPKGTTVRCLATTLTVVSVALLSCTKSSTIGEPPPESTVHPELVRIEHGRLVDVYALDESGAISLLAADVIIGPDISDQRPTNSTIGDNEILYDFLGTDPNTLQPRLLIPRRPDSQAFQQAFAALDDNLREVSAMRYGQGGTQLPYSVVPRNSAIRLTFSASLDIDDSFFVTRNAAGTVTSLRNTEAVQLLRIVGDPEGDDGFVPQPVRIIAGDRTIMLDPVLLGTEGVQYQTSNNAAGLPESSDQVSANIRVAIALDGPLAIPGLRESSARGITGRNNSGRQAIIRDFRSGNSSDTSSDLSRGFVRDSLPLRIVGAIPMYLERVEDINEFTQEVTVYKNGLSHEIDRGDVFRFQLPGAGKQVGTAEVVTDPGDDQDSPTTQHVRVRIRRLDGLAAIDPRNLPGYPAELGTREPWLVANAPSAICIAEYTAGGATGRDDPSNFLTFSPEPLTMGGARPKNNEFVSPFAGAIVRFTKPVDIESVKWADTFFFAMRDLTSEVRRDEWIASRPNNVGGIGMDPDTFNEAKYRTPYLVASRIVDEDGSQTLLRLQPIVGFYLDERMRNATPEEDYRYFLHVISNSTEGGVRDLAGNPVDLQGTTAARSNSIVIDFTLDTRKDGSTPVFEDNLAVSIVRRFAHRDEDEHPSPFLGEEVRALGSSTTARTNELADLFGAFLYFDGRLIARPTSRTRAVVDNFNQLPAVTPPAFGQPQDPLAWCPQTLFWTNFQADQRITNSAGTGFGQPIQNPLNPAGCRLQTLWREVDVSLSRDDPFDFNLDIEQMYWMPFAEDPVLFDEFDRVSLRLGHSEYRPISSVDSVGALAQLPESGLQGAFEQNYLSNKEPTGNGNTVESSAPRAAPYTDARLTINPSVFVRAENGGNRFMPLPEFQEPYFVWRDETVLEQGGNAGGGSDVSTVPTNAIFPMFAPYIVSPFAMGQASTVIDGPAGVQRVRGYWNDATNYQLSNSNAPDNFTGGLLGAIACPLLADFQTFHDSSELPATNPFAASGANGWQVSVTVGSGPDPRFRVFSGGRPSAAPQGELPMGPNNPGWTFATGGWAPNLTNPTAPWTVTPATQTKGDNTMYWMMMDLLKRQSVATNGFVDLNNPHRVPTDFADARLGPYYMNNGVVEQPADVVPSFGYSFDPPLTRLPAGTSIVPQFRGASAVDESPWYWNRWINTVTRLWPAPTMANPSITAQNRQDLRPTAINFSLDPLKAGDAHLRKWDTRPTPGSTASRDWWTYLYNRTVTTYVEDANELMNPEFTANFAGSSETFAPNDIRYVNWRFIMLNNVTTTPPIDPSIETFAFSYRFERR